MSPVDDVQWKLYTCRKRPPDGVCVAGVLMNDADGSESVSVMWWCCVRQMTNTRKCNVSGALLTLLFSRRSKQSEDDSWLRVETDCCHHHLATAFHHLCPYACHTHTQWRQGRPPKNSFLKPLSHFFAVQDSLLNRREPLHERLCISYYGAIQVLS